MDNRRNSNSECAMLSSVYFCSHTKDYEGENQCKTIPVTKWIPISAQAIDFFFFRHLCMLDTFTVSEVVFLIRFFNCQ